MHTLDEKLGAFIVDLDLETIHLGLGGSVSTVSEISSEENIFYLKDFYSNTYLAYRPRELNTLTKTELLQKLDGTSFEVKTEKNEDDLYRRDFATLKESFSEDLKKVVLVSRETYFATEFKPSQLIARALSFGTGYPYAFWSSEFGIAGSTPELLFSIQDGSLKTFALAGTAQKGQEEELLHSTKDRVEHDLVIRNINEVLESFDLNPKASETKIATFKNLVHLRTDIEAKVEKEVPVSHLLGALSPTAALGGYPKTSALQFLKNTEYGKAHPKRYFGSAMGLVTKTQKNFFVMIRNVQWNEKELYIESGGGVVSSSELAKELEEIHLKRKVIKDHYL